LSSIQNKIILTIVAAVVFYSIIIFYSDYSSLIKNLNTIQLEYYIIIIPLVILSYTIRGIRYHVILKQLGIKLKILESIMINFSGFSMWLTPGGFGTLIKSHIIKQKTGKSFSTTAPIVAYEKFLELITTITIIGILLFFVDIFASKIVFLVGLGISLIFISLFSRSLFFNLIKNFISKIKFLQKYFPNFEEIKESSSTLISPRNIVKNYLLTLTAQIPYVIAVALIFKSIIPSIDPFWANQVYFTSLLIGALSFIPGGLVITETGLLGLILSSDIGFSAATVTVLILRFVFLWMLTIIGVILLKFVYGQKFQNNTEKL